MTSDDATIEKLRAEFSNEAAAQAIANDKRKLERELRGAVACLVNELRPHFRAARFCFATKRLLSQCGRHSLEWRLRDKPAESESYHSQQTRRGIVCYVAL